MSSSARLMGFIRLMRLPNCFMMGFAVVVGATVALRRFPAEEAWLKLFFGFLTGFLLLAASNALNDYWDREIDAINEPDRPIPSGLVRPREALAFSAFLTALGLALAWLTGLKCFLMAIATASIADAYVTLGKRTGLLGNAMVSLCVAVPFAYGSLITVGQVEPLAAIFASMAFLANIGREVNKGIVDVPGDSAKGVMTVAVKHGPKVAAYLAAAFYFCAIGLSILPPLLSLVSWPYIPLVALTDAGFIWASISIARDQGRDNARKVKNAVLIWMTTGMLAFLTGSLT